MRKFLCSLLSVCLVCGCAAADVKVGFLTKLNITEDEYKALVMDERKTVGWNLLSSKHEGGEAFVFYDSLMLMQMALNAGEIDEAALPKAVAEYVLNTTPGFTVASVEQVRPVALVFGFRDAKLRDRFNEALHGIKRDGTLLALQEKYLSEPGIKEPEPVKMERYSGAETIRVAVTGDLPPIDFIATDGEPAGFNTAVLAELGKALQANIRFINVEAGARNAILASGRADAVFWYRYTQDDAEGVLLSEPYYTWDKFLYIRKK